MGSLSCDIENYLKQLLAEDQGIIVVQRSALSEHFCCVPSQINYVLRTRFTPINGYIVETRRGGGGYVCIREMPINDQEDLKPLMEAVSQSIGAKQADDILDYLAENDILSVEASALFKTILSDRVLKLSPELTSDSLRARILSYLLAAITIDQNKDDVNTRSPDPENDQKN